MLGMADRPCGLQACREALHAQGTAQPRLTCTSSTGAKVKTGLGLPVVLVPADAEGQGDLPGEASWGVAHSVTTQHNVDGCAILLVLQLQQQKYDRLCLAIGCVGHHAPKHGRPKAPGCGSPGHACNFAQQHHACSAAVQNCMHARACLTLTQTDSRAADQQEPACLVLGEPFAVTRQQQCHNSHPLRPLSTL